MFVVALVFFFALAGPVQAVPASDSLAGMVVDADGKPAARVDVLLSSGLPPTGERPLIGGVLWMTSAAASPVVHNAVLGRTRTDQRGHFQIELPAEIVRSQEPLPVALWAYREGTRVASRRLPWATPAPAEPIRLVIEKAAASSFRLLGPDGAPDAGARVEVSALDRLIVPDELAGKVASVAGPDGNVMMPAFATGEVRWVRVVSSKFGTQLIRTLGPDTAQASACKLEPIGRVAGRVVAGADKPVAGLRIRAQTFPEGYDLGGTVGSADVTTDETGRFAIPAIAAGRLVLMLDLRSRPDLPYRGLPPANHVVETGQTTTVDVRLKRAVRLEGVIRERTTGLPIAGVYPEIPDQAIRPGGNAKVVTDALGHFEGYMEGQQPYAFLFTTPRPYFIPSDTPDTLHLLPAGATEFKLPPTELVRGVVLRGSVKNETGKIVAGALVRASWGGENTVHQSVAARTDTGGSFRLEGLDPLADLKLTAESDGLSSGATQTARAGPEKHVELVARRSNTVQLAGRVVDAAGTPIRGAEVRLRSQTRYLQGQVWRVDPIVFSDRNALTTDSDGRYQTPCGVPAGVEYEATVTTRDMPSGRTAWLKPGHGPTASFSDVVLHRLRSAQGVVHDSQGRPIEGVTVLQSGDGPIRTRAVTDLQGRFRITGIIEGKAILFARKTGFRFQGRPIDTEAGPAEIVLGRFDETPAAKKTLESVLPHDQERALARRLLTPYVEKVIAKGTDVQKYQALVVLAKVDPARTLELLGTHAAGKPQFAGALAGERGTAAGL
ncbi:MAG: carboxypeptidase regulatory-like domain-containing protein [Isosphaerales bacterium]